MNKIINNTKILPFFLNLLIFLFFVFISFLVNNFPSESFVVGGDFYQLSDPLKHFNQYFYAWINQVGQGQMNSIFPAAPFYLLLAFLNLLGFSSGNISSFYIFFFLYGSFLSFFISIKWIFPNISRALRMGGGLIYALNYFTFSILTYSWGFSHHLIFYIFIPLLVLLFLKILFEKHFVIRNFILFVLIFLFSTISYANTAFLLALFFIQFLLVVVFLLLGRIRYKDIWKKLFVFAFIYIFIFGFFLFSFFISSYQYIDYLAQSEVLGGDSTRFVKETSSSIINILSFDMNRLRVSLNIIYPLTLFFLLVFFLKRKKSEIEYQYLTKGFLIIFVMFVFFAVRIKEPFFSINSFLYKTQLFSFFRSPEKVFVFLPFVFVVIIIGILLNLKLKKTINLIIIFIFLCIPWGFYSGGVIDGLQKADKIHPYIVKIPDEYHQVKNIINSDNRSTSVLSLPYSVVNSINWSDYPKWGFIGQDVLYLLYDKYFISANVFDHPSIETSLSFKEYNKKGIINESKFIRLLQKFSGQFIIFHKDINKDWILATEMVQLTLDSLEEKKFVEKISDNDYFNLYKINDEGVKPIISSNNVDVEFVKINPTKYRIHIKGLNKNSRIEFNQAFSRQWYALAESSNFLLNCEKKYNYPNFNTVECSSSDNFFEGDEFSLMLRERIDESFHKIINDYANGWTIDPNYIKNNFDKSYYKENADGSIDMNLILYFKPQSYFYLGLLISGTTLFFCISYLIYDWRKRKKQKNLIEK